MRKRTAAIKPGKGGPEERPAASQFAADHAQDVFIKGVMATYGDTNSAEFLYAKVAYKNHIASMILNASQRGNGSFVVEKFFEVTLSKYKGNATLYFILVEIFTEIETGFESVAAKTIRKEMVFTKGGETHLNVAKCDQEKTWKYFGKILVWMSQYLADDMRTFLQELRDESFTAYDATESGQIVSLYMILTLLKTFPVCFGDCQGLSGILFNVIKQVSSPAVFNVTIRILKQIFKSYDRLGSSQFVVLIQAFPQLIMNTTPGFPDQALEAIGHLLERYPKVYKVIHFNSAKPMAGKDISLAYLKTLPLMYQCSPKVFAENHIKAAFALMTSELDKWKSKTEEHRRLLRTLSDFVFALGPSVMQDAKELGVKPEKFYSRKVKTEVKQYACIAFSICDGSLSSHVKEMDKYFVLSSDNCRALAKYCRMVPKEQEVTQRYFMKKVNALLFGPNDEDVKKAFEYLAMMDFHDAVLNSRLLGSLSAFLESPNPGVRLSCARFLALQQSKHPEISERLLSFVSTELSDDLREKVMKYVQVQPDSSNVIEPLEPLLYDTQISVQFLAVRLLCKIHDAEQRLVSYLDEVAQNLLNCAKYGERADTATIGILGILAENHPQLFGHYGQVILNVLANDVEQTDYSLKLMTKLIPMASDSLDPSNILDHVANSVHVLSVTERTAIGLDLLVAIVNRFGLLDRIVDMFDDLVELAGEVEEGNLKFQLLDVLALIGPQIKFIRRAVKNKSLFVDYSTVPNKALSFALSLVFTILNDESKKAQHQNAVEILMQLVKIEMPDEFVQIIIDYLDTLLNDHSLSRAQLFIELIPPITSALGRKAAKLIPKTVDLICANWNEIDIGAASKSVVWLMRQLPDAVGPHLDKIVKSMVATLKTAEAETGVTILFCFESFGEYIKLVDRLVLPAMLSWMSGMAKDTERSKTAIGILQKILQESSTVESSVSEVLRCLIFMTKQNSQLTESAINIIFELTVLLKGSFFQYLPEVSGVFDLANNQEYQILIGCIRSTNSIPPVFSERFSSAKHSARQPHMTNAAPHSSSVMPNDAKLTDTIINCGKMTLWFEKFVQYVFRASPSRPCVAFETIAGRHHTVRSTLFPIALALLYPKSEEVAAIFTKILTSPVIPLNILRAFLAALDHLEVLPGVTKLPCESDKIINRAIRVGNFELALRHAELIYEETQQGQKATLINLYQKLNMPFAASGLLRELSDKSKANLTSWSKSMDSFSRQSVLGARDYKPAPTPLDADEFTKMIASFQADSYDSIRPKAVTHLFPEIRNDYDKTYPMFCQTALLFDLRNADQYMKMHEKYKDSGVLSETLLLEKEKQRIFDIWKVHFKRLKSSPLASFYSLLVGEKMVSKEELKPYYIDYLRTHLQIGAKAWHEMAHVVMSRLDEQDPNRLLIECELSEDKTAKLEDLLKTRDPNAPEYGIWNKLLGQWKMEVEDWVGAASHLKIAVEKLPIDSDAWLHWSKVNMMLQDYQTALQASLEGLAIGYDSVQFALRVLSVLLRHGSSEIYNLFLREFERIDIGAFLQILPQVIARLDSSESKTTVKMIIMAAQERDPHSVLYSLIVPFRSSKRAKMEAAAELIDAIRQTKPSLVSEIMTISEELIKITKTWEEMWFSAIDEASKKHVLQGDINAVLQTIPELHKVTGKDPTTFQEASFVSMYGSKLWVAHERLEQYMETRNDMDLAHAWCEYVSVFRAIRSQIQDTWSLQLADVSPLLANLKDTTLAVPGHYLPPIFIQRIYTELSIFKSKQRPRKMTIIGSNGVQYDFVLKANEDTRLDERVMQLFKFISTFVPEKITTHNVIPLSGNIGLIGYVRNCSTLSDMIVENRKYCGIRNDVEYQATLKACPNYENAPIVEKTKAFEIGLAATKGDDVRKILLRMSVNSRDWTAKRTSFTDTLAATSVIGYVLGLGDRHLKNIMMKRSARIVHIDFGDCFEVAMSRAKYPEMVPFRLTRTLIKAMDASGARGTFSAVCISVMSLLREKAGTIMGLLEVFQNDPLIVFEKCGDEIIERIENKLSGKDCDPDEVYSPEQQVELLVDEATDPNNLVQMFIGWNPWW